MNANKSKRSSNRSGAVLMTVLTISVFAAILLTAVLTFVRRAHTNAYNNYNSEQAYYIASSTLLTINDYLKDADNQTELLSLIGKGAGTVSFSDASGGNVAVGSFISGGDCKVTVSEMGEGWVKISVKGTCNGQEEIINAYYTKNNGNPKSISVNGFYCSGAASFGQAASSTGSIVTAQDYQTSNDTSATGSIITGGHFINSTNAKWMNDPDNTANSFIIVEKNMYMFNQSMQFKPNGLKGYDYNLVDNNNNTQYISIGGAFAPSGNPHYIGTDSDHQMDIYCNAVYLGGIQSSAYYHYDPAVGESNQGQLTMYGNLYVYKQDTPDPSNNQDGDFIVTQNTAFANIYGNVYVEGDFIHGGGNGNNIKIMGHTNDAGEVIGGTLYLSPTSTITANSGVAVVCNSVSGASLTDVQAWINNGSLKIRKVPNNDSAYVTAGELATMEAGVLSNYVKTDGINRGVAGSRNYKPSTSFDDYKVEYPTAEEMIADMRSTDPVFTAAYNKAKNNSYSIYRESDQWAQGDSANTYDAGLDIKFAYHITDSCYIDTIGQNQNIYIDLDQFSGSTGVIMFKSSAYLNFTNIIIKNGTRDDNGNWITKPSKNLYFVMEEGSTSVLGGDNSKIVDYYTYKFVLKGGRGINLSSYADSAGAQQNVINTNGGYTLSGSGDYGVYTPALGRTFLMINSGAGFSVSNNNSFFECVVYAPGAPVTPSTSSGIDKVKVLKDYSSSDLTYLNGSDARMLILGALICGSFNGGNTFGISYMPIDPGAGFGGADAGASIASLTFSHYESR